MPPLTRLQKRKRISSSTSSQTPNHQTLMHYVRKGLHEELAKHRELFMDCKKDNTNIREALIAAVSRGDINTFNELRYGCGYFFDNMNVFKLHAREFQLQAIEGNHPWMLRMLLAMFSVVPDEYLVGQVIRANQLLILDVLISDLWESPTLHDRVLMQTIQGDFDNILEILIRKGYVTAAHFRERDYYYLYEALELPATKILALVQSKLGLAPDAYKSPNLLTLGFIWDAIKPFVGTEVYFSKLACLCREARYQCTRQHRLPVKLILTQTQHCDMRAMARRKDYKCIPRDVKPNIPFQFLRELCMCKCITGCSGDQVFWRIGKKADTRT